eukprot:TRINITY_DN82909_c0_g1_i1.p1 TRINITY_DN82909_c0_g1~~TRINITY_DN82909_c0_g1_i1.p1  ORF type:complete len:376 (+),score=109.92 TRINITY_DN82909_c0_g1_i1:74-1201(+)
MMSREEEEEESGSMRYLRVRRGHEGEMSLSHLDSFFGRASVLPVPWAGPRWYSCPHSVPFAHLEAYRTGLLFGMDVASWATVQALSVERGDIVLDLCCAPGAKLCSIAELLEDEDSPSLVHPKECKKSVHDANGRESGFVVGVDANPKRLAVAERMVRKYKLLPYVRLACADGRVFPVLDAVTVEQVDRHKSGRKARRMKRNRGVYFPYPHRDQSEEQNRVRNGEKGVILRGFPLMYDRVLVDAECTHDGSTKHMKKWKEMTGTEEKAPMDGISDLQLELLKNGFSLLKDGGCLVYATCSLRMSENEGIVQRFMKDHQHDAVLVDPVRDDGLEWPEWVEDGAVFPQTKLFRPGNEPFPTSGQFIAKITKRQHKAL